MGKCSWSTLGHWVVRSFITVQFWKIERVCVYIVTCLIIVCCSVFGGRRNDFCEFWAQILMFVWIPQMSVFKQQTWQHVEPDVWFTGLREQGRLSFSSPGVLNCKVSLTTCMIDSLHHFVVKLVLEELLQLLLFNTMILCYGQKFIAVYFDVLKHRHST